MNKIDKKESSFFIKTYNGINKQYVLDIYEFRLYSLFLACGDCCFLSRFEMRKITGISERKITYTIKALEEKKFIYVQRKYKNNRKEKDTLKIFPIHLSKDGTISKNVDKIIEYRSLTNPSDY